MNKMWILAAAQNEETSDTEGNVITGGPTEGQTVETTGADQPNGDTPTTEEQTSPPSNPWMQYLPFILIAVVMYMLLFRGPKKKQQKHKQMVQALQRNDRVQTIGGILGTVIDIKDDEITLKIDESNNTKLKISAGAIAKVTSQERD